MATGPGAGMPGLPGSRRRAFGAGEWWAVAAAASYVTQGLFARRASVEVDPLLAAVVMMLPTWGLSWLVLLARRARTARRGQRASVPPLPGGRAAGVVSGWPVLAVLAASAASNYLLGNPSWVLSLRLGGLTVTGPGTQSVALWGGLLGALLLGERVAVRMGAGLGVFAAGLVVLGLGRAQIAGAGPHWPLAIPLALFTGFCWALGSTLVRAVLLRGVDRFWVLAVSSTMGLGYLNGLLLAGGGPTAYQSTAGAVYLVLLLAGLFNVAAQISLTTALGLTTVASVSVVTTSGAVLAPLLAHLLLGDPLNLIMVGGIGLALGGAFLVQVGKAAPAGPAGASRPPAASPSPARPLPPG